MKKSPGPDPSHFFSLKELTSQLPDLAETILQDVRMVDRDTASCRLVRIYKQLPLHFHRSSDENVYVLQGRAIFQLEKETREISEGMFVQFPKGARHAVLTILEEPLLTLTIDTPRRPEDDITFIDPRVSL